MLGGVGDRYIAVIFHVVIDCVTVGVDYT